ncbi:hypothetical protein LSH36_102g04002 [Paralvinella palmiformis]|uniref:DUF1279 domain-containing protein n=1 Tax=Paralvinella palmiformis TaxID=53620 RepID=A0AAD9K015_9ANNE|nr:hypothetical protein LSH36_102g04002 [Paralvinella palmiformis]
MLTKVVRRISQQNRVLFTAMLSSRATNAMSSQQMPSSTVAGVKPKKIDLSSIQDAAAAVDLSNIQDAAAAEYHGVVIQGFQGDPVDRFSTGWAKDVMAHAMSAGMESHQERIENRQQGIQGDIEPPSSMEDSANKTTVSTDSYRTEPTVSLYSVMQSQVPRPYGRDPTHLNMPGGCEMYQHKYVAGMLHETHPSRLLSTALRWCPVRADNRWPSVANQADMLTTLRFRASSMAYAAFAANYARSYSGSSSSSSSGTAVGGPSGAGDNNENGKKLSQTDKLKRAVKEYGATVIVFHVCISLVSLGGFYLAVSSGIDVISILQAMGVGESLLTSRVATGASTFVIAYAVHKVFAPVRIAITLTSAPFIVRYLRLRGLLKPPAPK